MSKTLNCGLLTTESLKSSPRQQQVARYVGKLLEIPGSEMLLPGPSWELTKGQINILQKKDCKLVMRSESGTYYYNTLDENNNVQVNLVGWGGSYSWPI
jgi:hypothetical protein